MQISESITDRQIRRDERGERKMVPVSDCSRQEERPRRTDEVTKWEKRQRQERKRGTEREGDRHSNFVLGRHGSSEGSLNGYARVDLGEASIR